VPMKRQQCQALTRVRDDSLARFFRGEGNPSRISFSRSAGSCATPGAQSATVAAVPIALSNDRLPMSADGRTRGNHRRRRCYHPGSSGRANVRRASSQVAANAEKRRHYGDSRGGGSG
jgi:hypothetical protein